MKLDDAPGKEDPVMTRPVGSRARDLPAPGELLDVRWVPRGTDEIETEDGRPMADCRDGVIRDALITLHNRSIEPCSVAGVDPGPQPPSMTYIMDLTELYGGTASFGKAAFHTARLESPESDWRGMDAPTSIEVTVRHNFGPR